MHRLLIVHKMVGQLKNIILTVLLCVHFRSWTQPASIGLQLTMQGKLEVVNWQTQWGLLRSQDSVYYADKKNPDDVKKVSLYEFRFLIQPVALYPPKWLSDPVDGQYGGIYPPVSLIYPELMDSVYGNVPIDQVREWNRQFKPSRKVPTNGFEDYFGPNKNLTNADKAIIRSILLSFVKRNFENCQPNGLRPTGILDSISSLLSNTHLLKKWNNRYHLKSVLLYVYEYGRLVATIGYDHNWSTLMYDRLHYDTKGRVVMFQRRSIGDITEYIYTFGYNNNDQVVHINTIRSGFRSEQFDFITLFSYTDFLYENNVLSQIVNLGDGTNGITILKYYTKGNE